MPTFPPQIELARWVALSTIPQLGGQTFTRLLAHFGTPEAILAAQRAELLAVRGIGPKLADAISTVNLPDVQRQIHAWQKQGIAVLRRVDAAYPAMLRGHDDAPPVLFLRGARTLPVAHGVALVGTRRPQRTSTRYAHALARALAVAGRWVVSGLALGIDTAAHRGALAGGGPTLAVLGCGVNVPYPQQNRALFTTLGQRGVLLSEYPPSAAPRAATLVARNRLIAALSCALVVVETNVEGGSWHTVRFARAQGVPIFVPPNHAAGNQRLLAQGAHSLPPDPETACAHLLEHCTG